MRNDLIFYISQLFVLITYFFGVLTFFTKKRERILKLNFMGLATDSVVYLLLSAYTGFSMILVAAIRNILFLKFDTDAKRTRNLIIILALVVIMTILTYNGVQSIIACFSCSLYTYALWQKDTRKYKLLVIPVSISWIIYNIYIFSIFTVICESIVAISATVGICKDKKVN